MWNEVWHKIKNYTEILSLTEFQIAKSVELTPIKKPLTKIAFNAISTKDLAKSNIIKQWWNTAKQHSKN